jgi:hypothetical protein
MTISADEFHLLPKFQSVEDGGFLLHLLSPQRYPELAFLSLEDSAELGRLLVLRLVEPERNLAQSLPVLQLLLVGLKQSA